MSGVTAARAAEQLGEEAAEPAVQGRVLRGGKGVPLFAGLATKRSIGADSKRP